MEGKSPWGTSPPGRPRPGAGRSALARRAKARGGNERKRSPAAARRALKRGKRATKARGGGTIRGAAAKLRRFSRLVEQRFATRQRLRHVLIALAGLWVIWTFALGDAGLPRLWATKSENSKLTRRIDELRRAQAGLQSDVESLDDPENLDALEHVAREELGMVKDGEVLVRFYEDDE